MLGTAVVAGGSVVSYLVDHKPGLQKKGGYMHCTYGLEHTILSSKCAKLK